MMLGLAPAVGQNGGKAPFLTCSILTLRISFTEGTPMLFLESKTMNLAVDTAARTQLLHDLQEQNTVPLIRSHRRRCFEDVLFGMDHVSEMETSLANSTESTIGEPYVRGDLFCFDDHILFLVFEDNDSIRAGIVYEARTPEPF